MRTNNTIISLATLFTMVLVSSCTKTDIESELESTKSQLLYVTADIAKDAASRVSMEAVTDGVSTTINLDWENTGETFDVIDANNIVVAKFKQTDDTTDKPNKFVGQLTNAAVQAEGEYTIVYPSAEALDLSEQNGTLDNSKIRMCGTYTGTLSEIANVEFTTHMTAIIKLHFKINGEENYINASQIRRVVVKDVQNQILFSDGEPRTGNITINKETDDQDVIYLNIPATAKDTNINFAVTTTSASYNGTLTPSKDIKAGTFYNAAITLNESSAAEYNSETTATESEDIIGEGTAGDPYLITSAEDLQWLVDEIDENSGTNSYGKHYKLTTDISIETTEEKPWNFCPPTAPFMGNLDGNGKTITGNIVAPQNAFAFGFIGYSQDGNVENLNINANVIGSDIVYDVGPMITGNDAVHLELNAVGAVVGANIGGTIDNCTNLGTVKGGEISNTTIDGAYVNTGGVVGISINGNIENSNNEGEVIGACSTETDKNVWNAAGGVAGNVTGTTISACENTGEVTGGEVYNGESIAGGIIGNSSNLMGDVIISSCINNGVVNGSTAEHNDSSRTGGIIGNISDADNYPNDDGNSKIECCVNNQPVTGGKGHDHGDTYTGGIAGYDVQADIISCENNGTVTAGDTEHEGDLQGGWIYAGGIVGYFSSHNTEDRVATVITKIINCANTASVNGPSFGDWAFIGGIVGQATSGHMQITVTENSGAVDGKGSENVNSLYVGGISGRNVGDCTEIFKCTNNGTVKGGVANGMLYTGGISGSHSGACTALGLENYVSIIYDCINETSATIQQGESKTKQAHYGGIAGDVSTHQPDAEHYPYVCNCCMDNSNCSGGLIGNGYTTTENYNGCTSETHQ